MNIVEENIGTPSYIASKKKYLYPFIGFMTLCALFYAAHYYIFLSASLPALVLLIASILCFTIPLVDKISNNHSILVNYILSIIFLTILSVMFLTGGIEAPATSWLISIPILSVFLTNSKQGTIWLYLTCVGLAIIYVLQKHLFLTFDTINIEHKTNLLATSHIGLVFFIFVISVLSDQIRVSIQVERDSLQDQAYRSKNLASLGEMAGGIAHEINNPLMIINGSVMVIERMRKKGTIDEEKLEKHLNTITKTVNRTASIIKGLKTLARDGTQDSKEIFQASELTDEVFTFLSGKIRQNNIKLTLNENDPNLQSAIVGQKVQLSQVLLNLISNSVDAISNQEDPWIKVEFAQNINFLTIKIIDSGNGIPIEIQQKIFNPFFTTKEVGKGTGLGLSLCHTIMDKNNGNIYIDNNNPNTCFVIEIPLNH